MTARLIRLGLLTIFTVGGAIVAVLLTDKPARTQEPKGPAPKTRDTVALQCINCHGAQAESLKRYEEASWGDSHAKITDFVKMYESVIWDKQDLHRTAFKRLDFKDSKNSIAVEMQANLAKVNKAGYQITSDTRCLACHATDLEPKVPLRDKVINNFQTEYGVGCEACHGAGNEYVGPHFQKSWHELTPEKKAEKGLVDLRDSAKRTEVCVSCHVGNSKEGKFVTHEMYAAGHPPLPAFELVTFSRDQPAHFHQPKNVALEQIDPKKALANYHYRPIDAEVADARNLATGAVGTMKAFSQLLADEAAKAGPNDVLDFALFDCYACHHELKIPSYRQTRGYKGAPGRPSLPAWPSESTRVLLKSLEGVDGIDETRKKFETASAAMQKAIDLKPFGSPADVVKAAKPLGESCDGIQAELAKLTFDTARTEKLYATWLEFVKNTPKDKAPGSDGLYLDYFGAQQAGWTIRALQDGLRGRAGLKVSLPSAESTEARQNSLGASVSLELRSSKSSNVEPSAKLFNDRLQKLGSFQLAPFLDAMNDFVKPLPPASK